MRDIVDDYGFAVGREVRRYEGARLVEAVLRDAQATLLQRRTYTYGAGAEPTAMAVVGADGQGYEARYRRGAGDRLERITYLTKGVETGTTT
jgi:hypothetical protein